MGFFIQEERTIPKAQRKNPSELMAIAGKTVGLDLGREKGAICQRVAFLPSSTRNFHRSKKKEEACTRSVKVGHRELG